VPGAVYRSVLENLHSFGLTEVNSSRGLVIKTVIIKLRATSDVVRTRPLLSGLIVEPGEIFGAYIDLHRSLRGYGRFQALDETRIIAGKSRVSWRNSERTKSHDLSSSQVSRMTLITQRLMSGLAALAADSGAVCSNSSFQ
jgi:hypothetical protein